MKKHDFLKYLRFAFYILTIGIMWYIPVKKIIAIEVPGVQPLTVDFNIQGYDPYDPGRGHYLALQIEPLKLKEENLDNRYSQQYYILLKRGKNGLAEVAGVQKKRPEKGYYIQGVISSGYDIKKEKNYLEVRKFPWKRFYINEDLAKAAEEILQKQNGKNCRLRVKLYEHGGSAVEDLLVNGKSIRELAKESLKGKRY
ncbi:MAG: GDYXXLXY domain-containing protein [Lentisphaeria bacterium]|nr:GDYXXLXY domain-containing protein [Lentisphaeria bacterium]